MSILHRIADSPVTYALRIIVLLVVFALLAGYASAEPVAVLTTPQVTITIHSEKCKLKPATNLTGRVTWRQNGKVTEGCYGRHPNILLLIMHFEDNYIDVAPLQSFSPVTGT